MKSVLLFRFSRFLLQRKRIPVSFSTSVRSHVFNLLIKSSKGVVFFRFQTSVSSLWCLYNLARHPEVQEKLHQEVISVLGEDGDVTPGSLAKMSYLKACVKESSR